MDLLTPRRLFGSGVGKALSDTGIGRAEGIGSGMQAGDSWCFWHQDVGRGLMVVWNWGGDGGGLTQGGPCMIVFG